MPGLEYAQHVFAMAVSGGVIFLIAARIQSMLDLRQRNAAERAIEQTHRIDGLDGLLSFGAQAVIVHHSGKCKCAAGLVPENTWEPALEAAARHIAADMLRYDLRAARLDGAALKKYAIQGWRGCLVLRLTSEIDSTIFLMYRRHTLLPGVQHAEQIRRLISALPFFLKGKDAEASDAVDLRRSLDLARQEMALARMQFLRLAHDIRMPLSTILMAGDRLSRELSNLPAAGPEGTIPAVIGEIAGRLVRQGQQLRLYLESLLAIESGNFQEGDSSRLSPGAVLLALLDSRQPEFEKRGVRLKAGDIDPEWTAKLPHATLIRALDNLLANALRFTPAGGTVVVGSQKAAESGSIWIEDSGPGLSPADFDEFVEMGRRNLGRSGGGHGIGLAAAFEMARAMGGRLALETPRLGTGARFLLVLPAES